MGARPTTISRDRLLTLGRGKDPWAFLAPAQQALAQEPADDALRFVFAMRLAELGLTPLARAQIEACSAQVRELPEVRRLREQVAAQHAEEMPVEDRIAICEGNLRALGERGGPLGDAFGRWVERARTQRVLRARDGNLVRLGPEGVVGSLIDHRGAVERFCGGPLGRLCEGGHAIAIEGLDPPMLVQRVLLATAPDRLGYAPRVLLFQREVMRGLDGLSLVDLREHLAHERVVVFAGEDAGEAYLRWARERLGTQLRTGCVATPGAYARVEPSPEHMVREVCAEQARCEGVLRARIEGRSRDRDSAYLAGRFEGGSLRVLIPTCRYSTYIRHASEDLAQALRQRGHEARVLIEPDSASRLSVHGYLQAIDELDPDLVVLINYPRSMAAGGVLPAEIPFVTWYQDAMPHLFDEKVGRSMGPRDFIVGPIDASMIRRYGYPLERSLAMPVVVSSEKFHDGEVDPERRARFACDVAVITHHSETPAQMRQRLRAESGADGSASSMLDALDACVEDLVVRAHEVELRRELRERVFELCASGAGDENTRRILRHYAIPLADRIFRHQAIAWAAQVCEARGWRLRLYGRGWEHHPALGRYAAGELAHGEDLRSAYQCARVTLQMCLTTPLHQRICECLLSGGLPVCRVTGDHFSGAWIRVKRQMARAGMPGTTEVVESVREGRRVRDVCRVFSVADSAEAMRLASLCGAMGVRVPGALRISEEKLRDRGLGERLMPVWRDPSRMLPLLDEHAFMDRESLARVLERAIDDDAWRGRIVAGEARVVREHLTLGAMIDRTIAMIRASLSTPHHARAA